MATTPRHVIRYSLCSHLLAVSMTGSAGALILYYFAWLRENRIPVSASVIVTTLAVMLLGGIGGALLPYQFLWHTILSLRRRRGEEIVRGCHVRILRGVHQGKVVRVYDIWDSRGQVRVDLGDEAKRAVTDVFMSYELKRMH
jgi:hypothetical protein